MSKAILYDATLCINCKQCEAACAEKNHLHYDDAVAGEDRQSEHKFTVVLNKNEKYMRRLCMNCADPACASVCPVAALKKTPEGPVTYDADRCMGCRYCMIACPFNVPKYEWNKLAPRVRKCDMCSDRVLAGQATACAAICPTGANKFGERDELIAEAQQRLRANPSNYIPYIYGLNEVGGTSVLLLSGVAFEDFGYPMDVVTEPMPLLTYRVLTHVPDLVTLGSVLLGGVWWITQRRADVAADEGMTPGATRSSRDRADRNAETQR